MVSTTISAKQERPTLEFNGETYHFSTYDYVVRSMYQVETYFLDNEGSDDWTKAIHRIHLFDTSEIQRALGGLINEYEDFRLPYKVIKDEKTGEPILMGVYYSPVHPIVIDKRIAIFKKIPNVNRVVYYLYVERHFNDPETMPYDKLQENKDNYFLDEKFIEKMRTLKIK